MAAEHTPTDMDLLWTVPETLLSIGTSQEVFARIELAGALLGEDIWGYHDADADYPESPSGTTGGDDHDFGSATLSVPCGIQYEYDDIDMPPGPDFSAELWCEHPVPVPDYTAGLWHDYATPAPESSADLLRDEDEAAPATDSSTDVQEDEATPATGDAAPAPDSSSSDILLRLAASGRLNWAHLLAFVVATKGPLRKVYGEITRLVTLHREAAHVFFVCTKRLGIQSGGQPDGDAAWKRRSDLRASVARHAHDALQRLRAATSAVMEAEEFIRSRPLESAGWKRVGDARRGLDDVKDSVWLMRDAVVREYFATWMILLNRAELRMLQANR